MGKPLVAKSDVLAMSPYLALHGFYYAPYPSTSSHQEKEAAAEGLASQSALLEVSQKNLKDAEVRCHSLEEAVGEERAAAVTARKDAADKLSELEAEVSGLRQEVSAVLVRDMGGLGGAHHWPSF